MALNRDTGMFDLSERYQLGKNAKLATANTLFRHNNYPKLANFVFSRMPGRMQQFVQVRYQQAADAAEASRMWQAQHAQPATGMTDSSKSGKGASMTKGAHGVVADTKTGVAEDVQALRDEFTALTYMVEGFVIGAIKSMPAHQRKAYLR